MATAQAETGTEVFRSRVREFVNAIVPQVQRGIVGELLLGLPEEPKPVKRP